MRLLKPSSFRQIQSKLRQIQIKVQDGRIQIVGQGAWYSYWRDPYHLMLTIPWTGFLALMSAIYLATNALFALLYSLGGDCIANAQPDSFLDKFFFSVQTLATIGYGVMYPKTTYANAIVTIEAMVGIIGVAVLTGLAFARFSRPTARVLFSKRERRSYKAWQEGGKLPSFVLEITSLTTKKQDEEVKPQLYARLGVEEYFQYDPTGDYLMPQLKGQGLVNGQYEPIPTETLADSTVSLHSQTLGLDLRLLPPDSDTVMLPGLFPTARELLNRKSKI